MLDPNKAAQYKGKISVYDDPIYIADAAVYLKAHQPDLGIDNPYELDEDQFNAAVDLLKQQRPNVGEYWSSARSRSQAFTNGDDQVGTTWQYQYFTLKGDGQPVASSPASQGFLPEEGATGMVGHLDDQLGGRASELHVPVDELHHLAEGERRSRSTSARRRPEQVVRECETSTSDPKFCDKYHAGDPAFWKRVYYWNTPLADCGDDRGETCMDYNDWVSAWTEIKG